MHLQARPPTPPPGCTPPTSVLSTPASGALLCAETGAPEVRRSSSRVEALFFANRVRLRDPAEGLLGRYPRGPDAPLDRSFYDGVALRPGQH